MNNSNNFGKYTLSNDSINKLLKCEDLIKPTYQPSDSTWHKLFIEVSYHLILTIILKIVK